MAGPQSRRLRRQDEEQEGESDRLSRPYDQKAEGAKLWHVIDLRVFVTLAHWKWKQDGSTVTVEFITAPTLFTPF